MLRGVFGYLRLDRKERAQACVVLHVQCGLCASPGHAPVRQRRRRDPGHAARGRRAPAGAALGGARPVPAVQFKRRPAVAPAWAPLQAVGALHLFLLGVLDDRLDGGGWLTGVLGRCYARATARASEHLAGAGFDVPRLRAHRLLQRRRRPRPSPSPRTQTPPGSRTARHASSPPRAWMVLASRVLQDHETVTRPDPLEG